MVRNKDGGAYKGDCWPGESTWIDIYNEGARDFWA